MRTLARVNTGELYASSGGKFRAGTRAGQILAALHCLDSCLDTIVGGSQVILQCWFDALRQNRLLLMVAIDPDSRLDAERRTAE
jgi:hypothetical protein